MEDNTGQLKLIQEYGWNWFALHAGQRMTSFRFFFVVIAVVAAGYYQTMADSPHLAMAFSILGVILTFFFWRLDYRIRELIDIGERLLLTVEARLSDFKLMDINIVEQARTKNSANQRQYFHSYRQIFSGIFGVFALSCMVAGGYAAFRICAMAH